MYYFVIQVLLLGFVLQSVHASTSCIAGEYYSRTDNTCMRCPPNSYSLAHSENIESCKCDNADFSVSVNVITTTRCTGPCPCPASTGLGSGVITDGYDTYDATGLSSRFFIKSTANVALQTQWVDVFNNQFAALSDRVDVMQSGSVIWNQHGSSGTIYSFFGS